MNRKIITILLSLFVLYESNAQNIESVLDEIETNNTTLQAYRNLNEAQKLENKTGIYLENPEMGFNYLWGDPSSIGNRKDFSFNQSFDFPTAYSLKKKIGDSKNVQSDLEYQLQRKMVLYKAKTICNELIYLNAKEEVLSRRAEHAEEIAKAYTTKFEQGEINILEKNKADFHLLNAKKDLEAVLTEHEALAAELSALNGGHPVGFNQNTFPPVKLPVDFESWYKEYQSKDIQLQHADNEIGISEKMIKLSRALSLPKFSGGYMSESVTGETFKGVSVGVSIPLWENKNTVKLATAQQQVAQELANDRKVKTYNQVKGQYEKAVSLKKTLSSYRETMDRVNSSDLLKKALEAGEISFIEYMLELTLYYETADKILSIENELNQLAARLFFYEL